MDHTGNPLWKSEEIYGAGRAMLGTLASNNEAASNSLHASAQNYIHTRIIAQDQTGDGKPEIIVGRNRMTNVKFFKNLRYVDGSSLSAMSWDGSQMKTLWETQKVPGYTVDYQVRKNASQPDRVRLFFVESDDNSNPLYFWNSEGDAVIHFYEIAKGADPTDKSKKNN